jgi:hypothetical protein
VFALCEGRREKYGDTLAQSVSRHAVTRRPNRKETPIYGALLARGEDFVLKGCSEAHRRNLGEHPDGFNATARANGACCDV